MKYLDKKVREFLVDWTRNELPRIKVKSGVCRYNFRCHNNAVHDALDDGEDQIAMVIYIDEDYPIVHFINLNSEGEYTDNTLGRWSEKMEYYLVRKIDKEDFFNIYTIFNSYRKHLRSKVPLRIRLFSEYDG